SGANKPELATGMVAVYYDDVSGTWKKADSKNRDVDNQWYSYSNRMWANAVTVTETSRETYMKAKAGTLINMADINTMWVWIPRFTATGDIENYNGGTQALPGAFDITFVDNKTSAHDSFTFGSEELTGFWAGKFELSHETLSSSTIDNNLECTNDTCSNASGIRILPNKTSLRYNNVSNFFYASLSMKQTGNQYGLDTGIDTTLDTHMMKNNEWLAVAYLTQSIYGRCTSSTSCTEVGINNNSSFITGYGSFANTEVDTNNGTYETSLGMEASTTGNIYGVYDMSGGAEEYVMGNNKDSTTDSGFDAFPEQKYYNYVYGNVGMVTNALEGVEQTAYWYTNISSTHFLAKNGWIYRGGYGTGTLFDSSYTTIFFFYNAPYNRVNSRCSSRFVLVK
ncbi:MAG: hypothetical protein PUC23_04195, partial [bacterium]|nr:hypothetical protein [bacterium]